jgi:mutator protein MutT
MTNKEGILVTMNNHVIDEIDLPFCPKCGQSFTKISARNTQCKNCGLDYYVNPRPCNAVIITDESNRILLVKRAIDPAKGLWDLPGGFIDIGETAEESVIREAKEELGVEVNKIQYLYSGYDRYEYKGLNYHTLGFVFTAQITSGEMKPLDDVGEIMYFAENEIPWDTLAFPVLERTLRRYLQGQ